ncbi:MAG: hypothetical protein OXQ93_17215 [Gemmatimonadota bacterium]|nr:hypothetical protein [Gemmatimonadota bacterium]
MNVISAILQVGAVVFAIVMTILFNMAEQKSLETRKAAQPEPDLSDCPPFLDE